MLALNWQSKFLIQTVLVAKHGAYLGPIHPAVKIDEGVNRTTIVFRILRIIIDIFIMYN